MPRTRTMANLQQEINELRSRLMEAEETLDAIRQGEVDALVVSGAHGAQVYTLQSADHPYRVLVEQMQQGAVTLSPEGIILYSNRRFADMVGAPLEKVIAASIYPFLPEAIHLLPAGHPTTGTGEMILRRSDGRPIPVLMAVSPLPVQGEGHVCLVVTDLTEQKRNEAIVASERLARTILESVPEAILVCDNEGRVIRSNQAAIALCGRSPLKQSFTDLFTILPPADPAAASDRAGEPPAAPQVIRGEAAQKGAEIRLRRYDGVLLDALLTTGPLRNAEEETIGCVISLRDITEHKQIEHKMMQAQKMESIGRLAGGIAHEFNNIMTIILGFGEMLEESVEPDSPLQPPIRNIQNAALRAAALTGQLLSFSRRDLMQQVILNLDDLLLEMGTLLKPLIGEQIRLRINPSRTYSLVKADPRQIEQILVNLVINARDAMPRGGDLVITTESVVLHEHPTQDGTDVLTGPYVVLSVRDTGTGMTEEVQSHAFEPFFTTKEIGKGTGLGLATCYGIARHNRGAISLDSRVGIGTTVRVYLPQVQEPAQTASPGIAPAECLRGVEAILVVEDETLVRSITATALRNQGYTVLEAGDGEEALRIAAEYPHAIRLVVTDVVMPNMRAKELVERLRLVRPDIQALCISGYSRDMCLREDSLPAQAVFLQKPFASSALLSLVRRVVNQEESGSRSATEDQEEIPAGV